MKVAFLTMFTDINYSNPIVSVVESHISMLLKNNIEPTMFVCEQFSENSKKGIFLNKNIKWQKVVNSHKGIPFKWYDYDQMNGKIHKNFEKEVKSISCDLTLKLKGFNFCFMYDIISKGKFLVHNTAIREVSEILNNLKFFSYIYETNQVSIDISTMVYPFSNMYKSFDNHRFITPTYEALLEVAKQYSIPTGLCDLVYNTYGGVDRLGREVKIIHKFFNLYDSDFLAVIPTNLDTNEQLEKVCMLLGSLEHNYNKSCKVVFCDYESDKNDLAKEKYKTIIKTLGEDYNLPSKNILFTSDLGFNKGLSDESIKELFMLSNIYLNLSRTRVDFKYIFYAIETSNFIVLNSNLGAFRELEKNFSIFNIEQNYISFGEEYIIDFEEGEYEYFKKVGGELLKNIGRENFITNKRKMYQTFNVDWIYYNQFEPLLKR